MIVLEGLERKVPVSRRISDFVRSRPAATWLCAVTIAAFLIRFVVVCFAFRGIADPVNTHAEFGFEMGWTARCIALGRGFSCPFQPMTGPTAIVPPIYPYLLAGVFKIFGLYTPMAAFVALSINGLFSALTCVPVYGIARDASGERLARWAALGWAIYPFAVYFSAARVWDYALTSLLFACAFWWAMRLHRTVSAYAWLFFGVLFGINALSNPSVVSILPFLLLIAVWRARQIGMPAFRRAMVAFLGFVVTILPWTIRNERVLHVAAPLRDGFWLEFYAGNIGDPTNSNSPTAHPASNPEEMALYERMGEPAYMAQKHTLSLESVREHKQLFVTATARRFLRYWTGYWSLSAAYLEHEPLDLPNVPFCTTLSLFMICGLAGWWRRDRQRLLPFLAVVILFPIPYYLTHASVDYRQPVEPELAILITAGMLSVRDRATASDIAAVQIDSSDLDFVPS
ncbi:MAG TPA: glycosyltransferase family 39 protein [Candidatus Aquilonibacter sp.]|nr:glycosyltransferase family 39 protein [Candidatus Aquilonibacter sp.]